MNDRITRQLEAFIRVRELRTTLAQRIPATSLADTLMTRIGQLIAQIENASAQQSSGGRAAQEATASKSLAREELLEDLNRISRTARSMRRTMPGLEEKFRSPGRLGDQELLTLARAYATDALPLKSEFIQRGLPENFLEDLNQDIEAFEEAITRQTQGGSAQVSATATIEDLAAQGMETLRELDPIMRNIFDNDAATLAAWTSARHIERAPRRRRDETPPPPQPTP